MPKKIDYPRAPITKSIELAEAVYSLGGSSSLDMSAEQMNRKIGGGFTAVVSATVKYGLITNTRGQLAITDLFKNYHLGYSSEEKSEVLSKAFLNVPLFLDIYERFKKQELPVSVFDKLLIREFDVNQQSASKVAKYFIDGAKATGLLNSDNSFRNLSEDLSEHISVENLENQATDEIIIEKEEIIQQQTVKAIESQNPDEYSILVSGPGINSTIIIREEEDLDIVEVMLKKIRKKLLEAY